MEEYEKVKKEMNPDLLKKAYKYLEKNANTSICYIFEALVGIMRGHKSADSQSVEMYLKKYEGFMMGLGRLNFKKINQEYAQEHLDALLKEHDKVLANDDFKMFIPFRILLSKICFLAILTKGSASIEDRIEKMQNEITKNVREIESKDALLKHLDIAETMKDDLDFFKTTQMKFFLDKDKRIEEELKNIDNKLANFEDQFFSGMRWKINERNINL